MAQKLETEITIGCPYCRAIYHGKATHAYVGYICHDNSCNTKWHEGKFGVLTYQVVSRDRRGLGRNRPVLWNIRVKALANQEEKLVTFKTLNRSIQLKRGDIITLSYEKKSKGIFRKRWTGRWHVEPSVLVNNTLNSCWEV